MKKLAVVIVNYNAQDYLETCLQSLHAETPNTDFQVVVIDNASDDCDFSRLRVQFPSTTFVQNNENVGFAAACNQGVRQVPAEFYLLLNPDVRILDRAVEKTVAFLQSRPEAGIVGCRVKNEDGSLQLACRRTIPRPSSALYRFLRLSFLFPRSKTFGQYNLSFMDDNEVHEVEAVSGSFLMFRREVLNAIGYLDEDFFLYGEDLDFCYRALLKRWKIYYFPGAEIIHYKKKSWRRDAKAGSYHYYNAMEIFYRKHYRETANPLQNTLVFLGIRLLRAIRG